MMQQQKSTVCMCMNVLEDLLKERFVLQLLLNSLTNQSVPFLQCPGVFIYFILFLCVPHHFSSLFSRFNNTIAHKQCIFAAKLTYADVFLIALLALVKISMRMLFFCSWQGAFSGRDCTGRLGRDQADLFVLTKKQYQESGHYYTLLLRLQASPAWVCPFRATVSILKIDIPSLAYTGFNMKCEITWGCTVFSIKQPFSSIKTVIVEF